MAEELSAADFEALGLWDPEAEGGDGRLELLRYLVGLGATKEDLLDYQHDLSFLGAVVSLRGGSAVTLSEASARSGLPEEKILQVVRASGFPAPGPDDRVFTDGFIGLTMAMAGDGLMFGQDTVMQLLRVMGGSMAKLADAIVSAFLMNVEPTLSGEGATEPSELDWARANAEASALLPVVSASLDLLLRGHLLAALRTALGERVHMGYETQPLCVGFVDLVDSTGLAQRLSTSQLGGVLTDFEILCSDTVTGRGGRAVKLIGDGVLFTAADEAVACGLALELVEACGDHPLIPGASAGLASGLVTLRDGDVFGPVVNLAARAATVAGPGEVVATTDLVDRLGLQSIPLGSRALKGFDEPVELCLVLGS